MWLLTFCDEMYSQLELWSSNPSNQILQSAMFISNTCTWLDTFRKQLIVFRWLMRTYQKVLHWKLNQTVHSSVLPQQVFPVRELFCLKLSHTPLLYPVACRISSLLPYMAEEKERANVFHFLRMWHCGQCKPGNSPSTEEAWTNHLSCCFYMFR